MISYVYEFYQSSGQNGSFILQRSKVSADLVQKEI